MASLIDIEAELSKAKAHLSNLRRQQQPQSGAPAVDTDDKTTVPLTAASLYQRAIEMQDEIEYMELNREVVHLVCDVVSTQQQQDADVAAGGRSSQINTLTCATETCTSLGLLLLRHPAHANDHGAANNSKSQQYHQSLIEWYTTLHQSTRLSALSVFRSQFRKYAPEFPSNERSSTLLSEVFNGGESLHEEWRIVAKCLVELQLIHDALELQFQTKVQQSSSSIRHQQIPLGFNWRLDIVDEICRPLAERLRFHFLEEQTGIVAASSEASDNKNKTVGQDTSSMDRLPEWLFRYLREVVDNHGVYSLVIIQVVQPFVDSVGQSLAARATLSDGGSLGLQERGDSSTQLVSASNIIQQLNQQCYSHSSIYFLREVARMARHALRAKSFFHHPDVVGSECQDRSIALRGIEQLFLFDSFLEDKLDSNVRNGGVHGHILPPRLVDTFLSSNEDLLQWWLEEERDGAIAKLHQCASSTLSSYQTASEEDELGVNASPSNEEDTRSEQPLFPPISELFTALVHSARRKSNSFAEKGSQQLYIANVIAPLCSEYLDMVHAEAAWLRKRLLARPASSSSAAVGVAVVSGLRSANLPSDADLSANVLEWICVINGTHIASQAVLHGHEDIMNHQGQQQSPSASNDILERVGMSIQRLSDAMVEDFQSAFVETLVMERAKFIGYMMRCPFVLSLPPDMERRGQRDHDKSGNLFSLSPDLNDAVHVVSVAVRACNANEASLKEMGQSKNVESRSSHLIGMLSFGHRSIRDALSFAITQKFLDIAIDPQGMTPEIHIGGAQQFQHDLMTFARLFNAHNKPNTNEQGPLERVVAASGLMSLESAQLEQLRQVLHGLAVPSNRIGALFGGDGEEGDEKIRLSMDNFYADDRLMEEAQSMLEVKGFGALALEEAFSIINRRC